MSGAIVTHETEGLRWDGGSNRGSITVAVILPTRGLTSRLEAGEAGGTRHGMWPRSGRISTPNSLIGALKCNQQIATATVRAPPSTAPYHVHSPCQTALLGGG
jgi:hypothetical protein